MGDLERGSLLLPVMALIAGFCILFAWLIAVEFRLYRLSRTRCAACGGEMSLAARRCPSCGEPAERP